MENRDAIETVVRGFKYAWKKSIADYDNGKVYSERCLQATIYFHLRQRLGEKFDIYIEPAVRIGSTKKFFIDILVCRNDTVLLAAELKYKPKGVPGKSLVAADLRKLMRFRNRKSKDNRVKVALWRRKMAEGSQVRKLSIAADRRIVFATFCADGKKSMSEDTFWIDHRPYLKGGPKTITAPRLLVCLAKTRDDGTASAEFFGRGDIE